MGEAAAAQLLSLVLALPFGLALAAALLEGVAAARGRDRSLAAASLLVLGCALLLAVVGVAVQGALWASGKAGPPAFAIACATAALLGSALLFKLRSLKARASKGAAAPYRGAVALALLSFLAVPFFAGGEPDRDALAPAPAPGTPLAGTGTGTGNAPQPRPAGSAPAPAPEPAPPEPVAPEPAEPEPPQVAVVEPMPEPASPVIEPLPEPVPVPGPQPDPEPVVAAAGPPPDPAGPTPPDPAPAPSPQQPGIDAPPAPAAAANPFANADQTTFAKLIAPVFNDRCVDCHGPDKQKGDLRLDTPEEIRKGGKSGPLLVAGVPEESLLYELIALPESDPDIMPSKGKPLTEQQITFIRGWIADGAALGDGKQWPVTTDAVAALSDTGYGIDAMAAGLPAPDAALVAELEEQGVYVRPLSANGAFIEVDFSHADLPAGGMGLGRLARLAPNLYALDLKRTRVADADLAALSSLTNLRKLHLQRTEVSDTGLAHLRGLANLEILNLYSTSIGDPGAKHLEALKNLKELYLFDTQVSTAGALALRVALPAAKVDLGAE